MIMDHFFIQTKLLLSGQEAPFTGEFLNMARGRDTSFTAYSSGEGSITLQYKSPFFRDDWISFYSFTGLSTGYAPPAYLTTPMTHVRAVSDGTGSFWCALTTQN